MKNPLVTTLVTADDIDLLSSTLLFTKTVRVAFPTFELHVYDNNSACATEVERKSRDEAKCDLFQRARVRMHHADWINSMVLYAASKNHDPLVIIDPDMIFWKNCEGWDFGSSLAGMFVPTMWNEWVSGISYSRLHTSFLWIKPKTMVAELGKVHPFGPMPMSEYRDFNPTYPRVLYVQGTRYFYDTCSALYHAICGECFSDDHLTHYDHLNSAAFYHYVKFEKDAEFRKIHQLAKEAPDKLRGLNFDIQKYYREMHKKGVDYAKAVADSRRLSKSL